MNIFLGVIVFFIWGAGFITWKLRRAEKQRGIPMKQFLENEREANNARRKEIDPSLFYVPDPSLLPADESDARAKVVKRAGRKMIRFPRPMKNLELKKAYGPSQLEAIAQYEENFHSYLEALIKWAEGLLENGRTGDALRILEHTVELGSEYRKSYMLAADICAQTNDMDKLDALLLAAEHREFTDAAVKQKIIGHIIQKRNEADL